MKRDTLTGMLVVCALLMLSTASRAATPLSAQAVIDRVAELFADSAGYQSSSHFTILENEGVKLVDPGPGFDIDETVERPNQLSLVTTQNDHVGVLVLADGTGLTVFNAPKLIYVKDVSGSTYQQLLASVSKASKVCLTPGQVGQLQLSLTVPFMFFHGSIAIMQHAPLVRRVTTATVISDNGQKVIQLIQTFVYSNKSKFSLCFLLDPATYLPTTVSEYAIGSSGSFLPISRQEFSKFVLLKQPLPQSGYTFNPPPGSVQITN
jgi:hypothetical protein